MRRRTFLKGATVAGAAIGIGFDISHPCLTFDKWRQILVLDESWRTIDVVQTYF